MVEAAFVKAVIVEAVIVETGRCSLPLLVLGKGENTEPSRK